MATARYVPQLQLITSIIPVLVDPIIDLFELIDVWNV